MAERQKRLKILMLLPFAPRLDGSHGGSRVMGQLIAGLAARHQVALVYLRAPDEPPIDPAVRAVCVEASEVPRPFAAPGFVARWRQRLSLLSGALRGRPVLVSHWRVDGLRAEVARMAEAWQPDIVQLEYHLMGQYLDALQVSAAPIVLTEHEPGVAASREGARAMRGAGRVLGLLDHWAWRRYEPALLRTVQAVVAFTERDRRALAALAAEARVDCIPFGIEPPARALDPRGSAPPGLVFVGNFVHPPNVDAAVRLARDIFPAVQARRPDARLYLIGAQPPPQLEQLASDSVVVTGYVPDLTPHLDRAALVVAPLRLGGGMRVKVLEALAAGKAMVASPLAVAGLDVADGEQVAIGADDGALVDQIVALLDDPERRAALGARARAWACANAPSWAQTSAAYEELYRRLLGVPEGAGGTPAPVTVAISTQGRPEALARCLGALAEDDVQPAEVIVVDQSADTRTRDVVERYRAAGLRLVYVHHGGRGLGVSQNIAIARATQPVVAVTDDDCVPLPGWVARIGEALGPDRPLDMLAGRVLPLGAARPGTYPVASRTSTRRADFGPRALPWDIGSGNNFAVRREWLRRVNGNDERLGPGAPGQGAVDIDLFYRLLRAGARIRYEPTLVVRHERASAAGRIGRREPYGYGIGACCLIWLRQGDLNALRVLGAWFLGRAARIASALRRRNWMALHEQVLTLRGTVRGMLYGRQVAVESRWLLRRPKRAGAAE